MRNPSPLPAHSEDRPVGPAQTRAADPSVEAVAMLDVDTAVDFLLEHGLVESDWIVNGDLTLRSAARRNRNLRIEGPGGAGYLIKQPDELAPAGRRTLTSEAAFYEFCEQEAAAAPVARLLPRLVLRDRECALHALELIPGAETLAAYHLRRSPHEFPVGAQPRPGARAGHATPGLSPAGAGARSAARLAEPVGAVGLRSAPQSNTCHARRPQPGRGTGLPDHPVRSRPGRVP